MIIPLNQKAMVRCSDGRCYPCRVLEKITDYQNLYEAVWIEFIDHHPDYSSNRMVTNMSKLEFGVSDEMQNR